VGGGLGPLPSPTGATREDEVFYVCLLLPCVLFPYAAVGATRPNGCDPTFVTLNFFGLLVELFMIFPIILLFFINRNL
jgi:hypothetical protein